MKNYSVIHSPCNVYILVPIFRYHLHEFAGNDASSPQALPLAQSQKVDTEYFTSGGFAIGFLRACSYLQLTIIIKLACLQTHRDYLLWSFVKRLVNALMQRYFLLIQETNARLPACGCGYVMCVPPLCIFFFFFKPSEVVEYELSIIIIFFITHHLFMNDWHCHTDELLSLSKVIDHYWNAGTWGEMPRIYRKAVTHS
jgi:hypothetical protein